MRELRQIEAALRGWPDELLTTGLILTAGVLLLIAWRGPVTLKAVALAYCIFP